MAEIGHSTTGDGPGGCDFPPGPYLLLLPAARRAGRRSRSTRSSTASARACTRYLYGRDFGFTGLTNYRTSIHDTFFRDAMVTTAKFVVCTVTIETLLGLGLALLVSRELRGSGLIRVGLILPMTIAPVVVGVMWRLIYDSDVGVTDPLFQLLGLSRARRARPQRDARSSRVVVVDVWEWTPLIFLILLAGLQSLPQEPLEAARVDGAGPRAALLRPHAAAAHARCCSSRSSLRTIDAIGTFDQIYVLTKGGPGTATQLISHLRLQHGVPVHAVRPGGGDADHAARRRDAPHGRRGADDAEGGAVRARLPRIGLYAGARDRSC